MIEKNSKTHTRAVPLFDVITLNGVKGCVVCVSGGANYLLTWKYFILTLFPVLWESEKKIWSKFQQTKMLLVILFIYFFKAPVKMTQATFFFHFISIHNIFLCVCVCFSYIISFMCAPTHKIIVSTTRRAVRLIFEINIIFLYTHTQRRDLFCCFFPVVCWKIL